MPFTLSDTKLDKNGRFVIVTGKLHNAPVILANVYAPNWDDEKSFLSSFQDMQPHCLILGGDFNCWLNPSLDRSSMNVKTQTNSAKLIKSFLKEFAVSCNLIKITLLLLPQMHINRDLCYRQSSITCQVRLLKTFFLNVDMLSMSKVTSLASCLLTNCAKSPQFIRF